MCIGGGHTHVMCMHRPHKDMRNVVQATVVYNTTYNIFVPAVHHRGFAATLTSNLCWLVWFFCVHNYTVLTWWYIHLMLRLLHRQHNPKCAHVVQSSPASTVPYATVFSVYGSSLDRYSFSILVCLRTLWWTGLPVQSCLEVMEMATSTWTTLLL